MQPPKIENGVCTTNYDLSEVVEMVEILDDWKQRSGEGDFLLNILELLRENLIGLGMDNELRVFDSCLGLGFNAIKLAKQGYDVRGNEIDPVFARGVRDKLKQEGLDIHVTEFDWRELTDSVPKESQDSVLCLGNSICYLFDSESQRKALKNFYDFLKEDGALLIDERNFQYMHDHVQEIRDGSFTFPGKYGQAGTSVHTAEPIEITEDYLQIKFTTPDKEKIAVLAFYPFKRHQLLGLLRETGFSKIEMYSDYTPGYNSEADFYQYVCVK